MSSDLEYMALAIKEAEKALAEGSWPIGCVIVLNDQVIATGHNLKNKTKNRLHHAEITAIDQVIELLDQYPQQATLYTTYEPCPLCLGAIVVARIGRVVTGVNLDQSGSLNLLEHLPVFWQQAKYKIAVTKGVLVEECTEVFQKFEKKIAS